MHATCKRMHACMGQCFWRFRMGVMEETRGEWARTYVFIYAVRVYMLYVLHAGQLHCNCVYVVWACGGGACMQCPNL